MIKKVKAKVENMLCKYPETRNNDMVLIFKLYKKYYGITKKTLLLDVLKLIYNNELPCFESIRRTRQKIQEEGNYRPRRDIKNYRIQKRLSVKDQIVFWNRL